MPTGKMSEVVRHLRRAVLLRDRAGMTDGQLLESFISRQDEAAIEALVLRHGPMVWGVCRRLLPNYHDAEDAFQATFLVLVRKAGSISPREMVANWLYGVAHQTALKGRQTAARRRVREKQVVEMPEPAIAEENLWRDLQPVLDYELSRLPDKYRVVIVLCDLEGKTRKEAARQLGLPEGTVASRLMRARAMLARRLARHGLPVSGGALTAVLAQNVASAGVPASVATSTVQAVTMLTAGQAAVIPAKVAGLMEGVLRTMRFAKLKNLALLVGALGFIALGLGLSAYHGCAQPPVDEHQKEPTQLATQEPATKDAGKQEPPVNDADKPDEKKSEAHYCWLVFGPNAKVRVLVRHDGKAVSVDRDGDGKFDGKGERFESEKDCKDVVILDPERKTSYVITSLHALHTTLPEKFLEVRVHVRGPLQYPQSGIITLAADAKDAPEVHFAGPLTIAPRDWRIVNRASRLVENDLVDVQSLLPQSLKRLAGKGLIVGSTVPESLRRGNEATDLDAVIITEGKSSWVCVCAPPDDKARRTSPFPKGVHPFVDVEFPAKKQGGLPIKKRFPLDQLFLDGRFRSPVRVPDEAGVGTAKLTFSFDAWEGAKVAPSSVEIPITEPQEGKKDPKQ